MTELTEQELTTWRKHLIREQRRLRTLKRQGGHKMSAKSRIALTARRVTCEENIQKYKDYLSGAKAPPAATVKGLHKKEQDTDMNTPRFIEIDYGSGPWRQLINVNEVRSVILAPLNDENITEKHCVAINIAGQVTTVPVDDIRLAQNFYEYIKQGISVTGGLVNGIPPTDLTPAQEPQPDNNEGSDNEEPGNEGQGSAGNDTSVEETVA